MLYFSEKELGKAKIMAEIAGERAHLKGKNPRSGLMRKRSALIGNWKTYLVSIAI